MSSGNGEERYASEGKTHLSSPTLIETLGQPMSNLNRVALRHVPLSRLLRHFSFLLLLFSSVYPLPPPVLPLLLSAFRIFLLLNLDKILRSSGCCRSSILIDRQPSFPVKCLSSNDQVPKRKYRRGVPFLFSTIDESLLPFWKE